MSQEFMKMSLPGKWFLGGFGITLLLMGLVTFASIKNTDEIKQGANKVQNTYQTLNTLTDFYASMTTAESARRGYIFLGNQHDLERYQNEVKNMEAEMRLLQHQLHPSLSQKRKFANLNLLLNQRLALLQQSIDLYQKDKSAVKTQTDITDRSIQLREQILLAIADIKAQEQRYLQTSLKQSEKSIYFRLTLEFIGIILSLLVILSLCFILERQWINRKKIESLESSLAQERKLGELKVNLFSMISHEFRTPLSVILLSSQLLKEKLDKLVDKSELKNLYRIQTSAKVMNHLLTDILTITRAESGKLDFKPQLMNIETFCLNLVEDLQLFSTNPHPIEFKSQGNYFRVNLDEKLLYSILSNLLLNAIKYSSNNCKIYLILTAETEFTTFQVIDEGIGIPLADQPKIYEPFYRGENVENVAGSGLGLAVVKKCVERHQGEIFVDSEVGIGTKFTIKIPHKNIVIA
jgi:signal transduction histidine kinase